MHKIGIIQFPGSNTERETFMACMRVGMQPYEVLWNSSHDILSNMDGFIIVGGFSYVDRSRAGIIAALDPIMEQIKIESEKGKSTTTTTTTATTTLGNDENSSSYKNIMNLNLKYVINRVYMIYYIFNFKNIT